MNYMPSTASRSLLLHVFNHVSDYFTYVLGEIIFIPRRIAASSSWQKKKMGRIKTVEEFFFPFSSQFSTNIDLREMSEEKNRTMQSIQGGGV